MKRKEVAIVGGGIVGLATAYQVIRNLPGVNITVFEKEPEIARHQTGNNSGVLHSGIYYRPGSLKAATCREGKAEMEAFCRSEGVPYEICGKVIVATEERELPVLQKIYKRGKASGVACRMIGADELREREPHASGIRAILVPEAGITDFRKVALRLTTRIQEGGGRVLTGSPVRAIRQYPRAVIAATPVLELEADLVVNCAGLYSDRVTAMSGQAPGLKIVPFRGEYHRLKPSARHLCRHLIYPVPDPEFPFLGAHFTRMIDGTVECGPNAVLAFAREGYRKTDINVYDLLDTLTYPGFVRLVSRYWRTGLGEMWRSYRTAALVRNLKKLIPGITEADLEPAPAGVRAQAVLPSGTMVDDFYIQESERIINVGNAPSPAATASLAIGRQIARKVASRFG